MSSAFAENQKQDPNASPADELVGALWDGFNYLSGVTDDKTKDRADAQPGQEQWGSGPFTDFLPRSKSDMAIVASIVAIIYVLRQ